MDVLKRITDYIINDKIEEAFNLIIEVEAECVSHAEYWNLRGVLCLKVGEYQSSIGCFEKAITIDHKNSDVYFNYAYALEKLSNLEEAAKYYGLAFRFTKDNELETELESMYEGTEELQNIFESAIDGDINKLVFPSVSIIIPSYNQKNYLKEAVESALSQDYPNLDIIVGDDNSNDGTDEIMRDYMAYPNLTYIKRTENMGAGNNSRDLLYNHCNSRYVMILNHDDYLIKKDYISQAVYLLRMYSNISFVWANCFAKNEENGDLIRLERNIPLITDGKEYFINFETNEYPQITGFLTTVFDREMALELNCFKERTKSKDLFLHLKLMLAGDVGFIKEQVAVYRIHNQSLTYNMPLEYDYSTIDELKSLQGIALEKNGYSKEALHEWLMLRLTNYFEWRLGILNATGEHEQASLMLKDIITKYPQLSEYLNKTR
ncbi:glycosyltransferase [Cytobacillus sp. Hm23]